MKVNINKYNTGGPFHRATFIPATMLPEDSVGATTTGDSDKKSGKGLVEDDLLEKLVGNGLTSDVNMLVKELSKQDMNSILSPGGTNKVLQLIGKVNEIKNNKEMWNEAITQSKANGSFSEVAVSSEGAVFYKNSEGTIGATDINSYTKNPKKYGGLLTVSDLLLERQRNNGLAFDTKIFNIATASIGMEKVVDYVSTLVKNIGMDTREFTDTYSKQQLLEKQKQTLSQLTGKVPSNSEIQALHSLQEAFDTPGDYTEIYTKIATGEGKFGTAMNYIWNSMDPRFKNKVIVTAAVNGVENPRQFMLDMMIANNNTTFNYEITPVQGKEAGGTDATPKPTTPFEIQHKGQIGIGNILWNDPKTSLKMNVVGNLVEIWDNVNTNTRVPIGPLNNLLNSHTGALLDKTNIFYGDKKIGLSDAINVIIDPMGGSARVYFPVDSQGNPNYKILREVDEIRKSNPNISPEELTKHFSDAGYSYMQFDKNFVIRPDGINVKPFLLLYGYADERSKTTENNGELRELVGSEENEVKDILGRIYEELKTDSPTGFWKFNWSNTYYKGNILIPYQETASTTASAIAGNIETPRTTLEHNKAKHAISTGRVVSAPSTLFD